MGVIQEDPVVRRERIHSVENGSQSRAKASGASSGESWRLFFSLVMTEDAIAKLAS